MRRSVLLLVPLLFACKPPKAPAEDLPVTLSFVAMNDFHGGLYEVPMRGDATKARGGLPWLKAAVDALRAEDPELVLLDAGDQFQGSWPVNATQGMGSIQALNLLGVDVAVPGNHDFDYGGLEGGDPKRGAFEAGLKASNYAWVSANIRTADGTPWQPEGLAPWTVIERKGLRIGVVGVTTTSTPQTTLLANVDDLQFIDSVEAIEALLPELEAADLDVTVLLGHLEGSCETPSFAVPGEDCVPDDEVGDLLARLPEGTFDVMVFGHGHALFAHQVGQSFVMENRSAGRVLGRLDLVVGPDGVDVAASKLHTPWELLHEAVDPGCSGEDFPMAALDVGGRELEPSAEALELIKGLEAQSGSLCTEVGCNEALLPRDRDVESPLGDYTSDAILTTFDEVDLAIQNSGGLRADLPAGPIRREHLQSVMPFDNRLLLLEMTGEQVGLLFRIGSSGAHGVLQLAGGSYHFDPERTEGTDLDGDGEVANWETERLCAVTVGGEPLDPAATYRVVTTDFLYGGGDHLGPAFEGVKVLEEGPLLRDRLFEYTEQLEGCIGADGLVLDPEAPRVIQAACPTE